MTEKRNHFKFKNGKPIGAVIYAGDNMSKKRFTHKKWYDDRQLFDGDEPFAIVDVYIQAKEICNKLNELNDEKERWKSLCLKCINENSILWNEFDIMREQGAEPSDAFKNYRHELKGVIRMTENKRFTVTNISTNGMKGLFKLCNDVLSVYDVARLINELLEENEQLKQHIKVLNECEVCSLETNLKLNTENEQLKKELRGYHNAFDCSQCMYHNYDWYDDGDEFEVCDKGNTEAQMEYHSCKDWEEL